MTNRKKDVSRDTFKPRGNLIPPNKVHKSKRDYDRSRDKDIIEAELEEVLNHIDKLRKAGEWYYKSDYMRIKDEV